MITQAQRNAALLAAHAEVLKIISHMVPAMFLGYAESYVSNNPQLIANISDAVLNAAEAVKSQAPAVPPVPPPLPIQPAASKSAFTTDVEQRHG